MEFSFKRKRDRKLAEDPRLAQREFGEACARQLCARLADLRAAARVGELPAGQPHPLKGDRAGQFAVTVKGGVRLVFEPANDPVPKTADGSIDWPNVTEVKVTSIEDYHD